MAADMWEGGSVGGRWVREQVDGLVLMKRTPSDPTWHRPACTATAPSLPASEYPEVHKTRATRRPGGGRQGVGRGRGAGAGRGRGRGVWVVFNKVR